MSDFDSDVTPYTSDNKFYSGQRVIINSVLVTESNVPGTVITCLKAQADWQYWVKPDISIMHNTALQYSDGAYLFSESALSPAQEGEGASSLEGITPKSTFTATASMKPSEGSRLAGAAKLTVPQPTRKTLWHSTDGIGYDNEYDAQVRNFELHLANYLEEHTELLNMFEAESVAAITGELIRSGADLATIFSYFPRDMPKKPA